MSYSILPLTEDPWQVFTLDLTINGDPFHAQVEIRYSLRRILQSSTAVISPRQ